MPALHPLEKMLAADWPPERWKDVSILLAVSGGADSVALLRAVAALKQPGEGRVHVAHFNHHLRPDSDEDAAFVSGLCRQLDLPFELGAATHKLESTKGGQGLEATARDARYEFLQTTAEQLGARYVATAHTADDQAETILHRIVRGTGLSGLAGIRRVRRLGPAATLIRPLLQVSRANVETYLTDLGQAFREDSTNQDQQFTRNRIRRELLPLLREHYNPEVADALRRLGALAGEAQTVIDSLVHDLATTCVTRDGAAIAIDCRRLSGEPPHLVRELFLSLWRDEAWPLQAMGYDQWDQLAAMAALARAEEQPTSPAPTKRTFPGQIEVKIENGQLKLRPLTSKH